MTTGTVTVTVVDDLAVVRQRVRECARLHGIDAGRTARFVLAVNEIVTNAISHGVPPATVTIAATDDAFRVAVHDQGAGVLPNRGGTAPPPVEQDHGRGLWLADRLCDRVDVHTAPSRTTVTLTLFR